jgi:hypothetical protein
MLPFAVRTYSVTDKHADERPTWKFSLELPGNLTLTLQGNPRGRGAQGHPMRRFWEQALATIVPPTLCMQSEWPRPVLPHQLLTERETLDAYDYLEIAAHRDNLRPSVLQSLPPECREIYLLKTEDELDIEQIATLLNISENRVKAMLAKATIAVAHGTAGRTEPSSEEPNR